jgi:hypothetical protein
MEKVIDQIYGQMLGTETAEILNVTYPSTVMAGEEFHITYDAVNKTAYALEIWGEIQDATGQPISGSSWSQVVEPSATYHSDVALSITQNLNGLIVIGHYEEPPPPPEINWVLIAGAAVAGIAVVGLIAVALKKKK